jgi:hypothetical protein
VIFRGFIVLAFIISAILRRARRGVAVRGDAMIVLYNI